MLRLFQAFYVLALFANVQALNSPPVPTFLKRLDATNSDDLYAKLQDLHQSYLKGTQHDQPAEDSMRPIYAPAAVVNAAYAKWTGKRSTPCVDQIHDAIFATPSGCMSNPAGPPAETRLINLSRSFQSSQQQQQQQQLEKRDDQLCVFSSVKCVPNNIFRITTDELVKKIASQNWDSPFFTPERIIAPAEKVEEAWNEWNKLKLGGKEGRRDRAGRICGKPEYEVGVHEGGYYATFVQREDCLTEAVTMTEEEGRRCRSLNVECL